MRNSGGYFETLGSPLIAGRTIEWSDIHDQRQIVVVSENFARAYWADPADAVGRRVRASFGESWFEIVGVHRDMRLDGVDHDAPVAVYFPYIVPRLWGADGAIAVYGVLSWIVAQRTREIGVRVALGARTADVRRMVLRQGLTITGLGLAIGLAAAALLSQLMASLLFGVSPLDPATCALVGVTIMIVALLTSAIPAARAARLDPIDALRRE